LIRSVPACSVHARDETGLVQGTPQLLHRCRAELRSRNPGFERTFLYRQLDFYNEERLELKYEFVLQTLS
jgi:hypothetical protein